MKVYHGVRSSDPHRPRVMCVIREEEREAEIVNTRGAWPAGHFRLKV